jgi:hypothetical protein
LFLVAQLTGEASQRIFSYLQEIAARGAPVGNLHAWTGSVPDQHQTNYGVCAFSVQNIPTGRGMLQKFSPVEVLFPLDAKNYDKILGCIAAYLPLLHLSSTKIHYIILSGSVSSNQFPQNISVSFKQSDT